MENELYSINIPYNLEFAKKINNVMEVKQTIHNILEKYRKRINMNREFDDEYIVHEPLY